MIKKLLYVLLGLLILFNFAALFVFHEDTHGLSTFTVVDPVTGKETTVKNCEELHALELIIRDCLDWQK